MVNFPTQITDCHSHNPALLDLFLFLTYLFYNCFPSIGKFWSSCCLCFHWLSIKLTVGCPTSLHSSGYSRADLDGLCDHLRVVCLNSVLLLLLVNFWVASGWNWCIYPSVQVSVKPHSFPWYSGACAAVIVHRNHFVVVVVVFTNRIGAFTIPWVFFLKSSLS